MSRITGRGQDVGGGGGLALRPVREPKLQPCSFVSSLLAGRLAGSEPLAQPERHVVFGAFLLSDIEGWTARVEQLPQTGPGWLDELGRAMNAYFIELTRLVYGRGGDVLGTVGDAFLCYWPAPDADGLRAACEQAARVACAFQDAASRHVDPSGRRLRTRIGISAGELSVALLGGVNGRWELLPLGAPIAEAALAERLAPAGGTAVAASAWRHLGNTAEGVGLADSGLVALTAPPPEVGRVTNPRRAIEPAEEALLPYVPAPLRGWSAPIDAEWLAELRSVTAVMAKLPGDLEEFDENLDRAQFAVRTFQQTIARFEGASKPGVDNKGITLSAVFGLPPRAHSDDAERALRAAASVREQLHAEGVRCSLGVAAGPVFCGLFGSDLRREYSVSGAPLNLAARLAHVGQEGILCDESTCSAVGDRFRFQSRAPVRVKGRSGPVAVRSLTDVGPQGRLRSTPLVGREQELAILEGHLDGLIVGGTGGVVVVEGEAGIGKSALVGQAAAVAEDAGVDVLLAAADAVERATGYYAWRQVFVNLLKLDGGAPRAADLERRVIERLGASEDVVRQIPLLASVLPGTVPDNAFTEGLTGDLRADMTVRLLTRIVVESTPRPTLLLVEDAQWLDSNSWSLLRAVARDVPHLLTLITTRALPTGSEEHGVLRSLSPAEPLRLGSLAPADTTALVRQRLGLDEDPAELARFIEERVAGHPYFCEALLKAMQEAGIIRVQEGRALVGELGSLDLPATVQGAVLSLVDRLGMRQQLTLKVAAVVGRSFLVRAVAETHPMPEGGTLIYEDLEALLALDLIAPDDSEAEPAYTFRHQITRDVVYGLLTPSQSGPLHRVVAEWYERAGTEVELERHAALLAHHWERAGEPDRAVPYLERAGDRALRGGAFREAAQFYRQLSTTADAEPERLALWEKGEASAYYYLGDMGPSRELLERALAHLDRPVPRSRLALLRGLMRAAGTQLMHLVLPGRYRGRRAAEKDLLVEAVDAYRMLALVNYVGGESAGELVYLFLAGLNLGEEAGPSRELAGALASAAGAVSLFNLRSLADRYSARARELGEHGGHADALAWIWNCQVVIEAQRGNWREAIAASDRALELFGEIGDYNYEAEIWLTREAVCICRGDLREAELCWKRTRELAARNANQQLEGWSLLDEVQSALGRGATEHAGRALEEALAIEDAPLDARTEMEMQYCLAATRLSEGRPKDALPAAEKLLELASARPLTLFSLPHFAAGGVEVYVELLEQAGTRSERVAMARAARRGCRALRRMGWTFHGIRARRQMLLGRVEWERGRRRRAERLWRGAEKRAAAIEMDSEVARARLELVRHGLGGEDRDRLLADAMQTFERLGANRQLEIARGL
ncbi:MAG TPA: AAA family ATPase [Solirubrobacteraceae bacterium]|jgi:class 3 adenylate cyclase/tetratricopeptide (TPR) repeat protein|nr:AAA family ATPase [Solirubrobacteraceae bacterium]